MKVLAILLMMPVLAAGQGIQSYGTGDAGGLLARDPLRGTDRTALFRLEEDEKKSQAAGRPQPISRHWSASALYSFDESAFSTSRNRSYGALLGYKDGIFNIRIAHQRKRNPIEAVGTTQPVDLSSRNTLLAATLNFGATSVYAGYGINRGLGSSPWDPANPYGALVLPMPSLYSHDMLAGVSYTSGRATFMASVIQKDDRSRPNQDARQAAIGMTYALSKRSAVHAAVSHIRHQHGTGVDAGKSNRALSIGLRHAF